MVDLNSLPLVHALAQSGSFTAAAERLGMSKTKMSLQIKALEQQLGVALFRRTTRQVNLTHAGEQLLRQCWPLFSQLQLEMQQLQQPQSALQGKLVVTAPEDYAHQILLPVMLAFSQRYPAVEIELRSSDQVKDLIKEGIDVAIRGGWLRDSSLKAQKLGDFAQWLLATPHYVAQHAPIVTPHDLASHTLIAFSQLRTPLAWRFQNTAALSSPDEVLNTGPNVGQNTAPNTVPNTVDVHFQHRFTVSSTASVQALLLQHAGLGILTDYTAKPLLDNGQLVRILPQWQLPTGGIYAVYPPGPHRPFTVRRFIEMLQSHLAHTAVQTNVKTDVKTDLKTEARPQI